jgi:hypothetical protein
MPQVVLDLTRLSLRTSLRGVSLRRCRLCLPDFHLASLRHQEQAEHEAYCRYSDGVDQGIADTARRLVHRRSDERHQSAWARPERGRWRACGAEGFCITAVGPGACAARAGRTGRPKRLISTQYHRQSAARGNRG